MGAAMQAASTTTASLTGSSTMVSAATAQGQQQQHASPLTAVAAAAQQQLHGLTPSIYSPYDPFLATSLAQVQANGLAAAAAAAGNHGLDPRLQNLAAAAGIGVRPSFAATGMAGIPHAATGLSLQAAIANQAAYGQALPATLLSIGVINGSLPTREVYQYHR